MLGLIVAQRGPVHIYDDKGPFTKTTLDRLPRAAAAISMSQQLYGLHKGFLKLLHGFKYSSTENIEDLHFGVQSHKGARKVRIEL